MPGSGSGDGSTRPARTSGWAAASPRRLASGSGADGTRASSWPAPASISPRSWESSTTLALGLEERAYLSASVARREQDRAEEAARQKRERTLERRSVKRLRSLVAVLTAAVVVAATLTAIAVNRNAEAQRASRLAGARELASAATANLQTDHELALLIALEAVRSYEATRSATGGRDPAPSRARRLDRHHLDPWHRYPHIRSHVGRQGHGPGWRRRIRRRMGSW